jgi:hypothetical protein
VVEQETSRSVGADRLKKASTAPLTYSLAQSEADAKTKCDRHGNLHEQGRTFKNSTKGDYFVDSNTLKPADGYRKISGEKTPSPCDC